MEIHRGERFLNESILVVEDDESLARSIASNLRAREYQVRSCVSVAEALFQLDQNIPELLLLDIDLPDGSGWEVARELRARSGAVVPVIVVSALRPNERLVHELGCVGVLEKPFPMEALVRQVETALHAVETVDVEGVQSYVEE